MHADFTFPAEITRSMSANPLPQQLAAKAEQVVNTLTETKYQYKEQIDPDAGTWLCDCNSFVGYLLEELAPSHYAKLPKEATQSRPRAFEYYDFFSTLTSSTPGGWHRIQHMANARRGDILAWRFPQIEKGHDTGHVVYLADTPTLHANNIASVRVYDSASKAHFEDTRTDGRFSSGVGSGFLNFQLDEEGRPTAFQFSPAASFEAYPIAIGRPEPLS